MSDTPLRMVTCPGCDAKVFIPGDLPPLATEPCKKCGHAIMMPMQLRQFELRSKIGAGGMGIMMACPARLGGQRRRTRNEHLRVIYPPDT